MIRVGDSVRDATGGRVGDVLAIAGNEAAVLFGGRYGIGVRSLDNLTPITPTPEPAPASLTGAQVAQVLDAWTEAYVKALAGPSSESALVQEMCAKAQAERERDNAG